MPNIFMVLESLVPPWKAEKRPEEMLFLAFLYSSVAILLSLWVFPGYASFAMVTFTVMACIPLMLHIIQIEREKEARIKGPITVKAHRQAIPFFIFLFLGMVIAFTFWFIVMPDDVSRNLFDLQINTITQINMPTGSAIGGGLFSQIMLNNLRILALCVLFSFIYGAGAIFILTWNASVISVAIGNYAQLSSSGMAISGAAGYFGALSLGLAKYLIHGIPELTAFFLGGLAGGMISYTLLRYRGLKKLKPALLETARDSVQLIAVAVGLLIVAAVLELSVSPLITG